MQTLEFWTFLQIGTGSFNLLIFLTMPRCISLDEIPLPYLPLSLDLRKLHPQNGKSAEVAMELSEHNPGVSSPPISSILSPVWLSFERNRSNSAKI